MSEKRLRDPYKPKPKRDMCVRLPESTITMLNKIADEDGIRVSDVIRRGLAGYFEDEAGKDPVIAALVKEHAQRALDEHVESVAASFGEQVLSQLEIRMPEQTGS